MNDERRVPITLRMPRVLLDRLKEAADARSHSMNAEIVQRLEEAVNSIFTQEDPPAKEDEKNIKEAICDVEYFLEMYGDWKSPVVKEGLCRYMTQRFAHGNDYFKFVAFVLASAGFTPTEERISYLTRRHGRMPSRPDFEKLDLQNPEWEEDFR